METGPIGGYKGPASVGGRVKTGLNIIDRSASAASLLDRVTSIPQCIHQYEHCLRQATAAVIFYFLDLRQTTTSSVSAITTMDTCMDL